MAILIYPTIILVVEACCHHFPHLPEVAVVVTVLEIVVEAA